MVRVANLHRAAQWTLCRPLLGRLRILAHAASRCRLPGACPFSLSSSFTVSHPHTVAAHILTRSGALCMLRQNAVRKNFRCDPIYSRQFSFQHFGSCQYQAKPKEHKTVLFTAILSSLHIEMLILPRQARDKHMGKVEKINGDMHTFLRTRRTMLFRQRRRGVIKAAPIDRGKENAYPCLRCHLHSKNDHHIYQDRLRTNIGKALKTTGVSLGIPFCLR